MGTRWVTEVDFCVRWTPTVRPKSRSKSNLAMRPADIVSNAARNSFPSSDCIVAIDRRISLYLVSRKSDESDSQSRDCRSSYMRSIT